MLETLVSSVFPGNRSSSELQAFAGLCETTAAEFKRLIKIVWAAEQKDCHHIQWQSGRLRLWANLCCHAEQRHNGIV
jgi:hypothetical protein